MDKNRSEKDIPAEPRVGVYVCHCGGNISNTVDVEKVADAASRMHGVTIARRNMFMCSDPGQDLITNDIRNGKINRVVVAACAPSLHELTFRSAILRTGLNPYLYVHANIREQVSFVHDGDEATNKAIAIVAAAVGKVKEFKPLEVTSVDVKGHVTVIGAGVAGLKSAIDIAKRGLKVSLIEKSPFLGGQTALLDKLYPYGDKASDIITALAKEAVSHSNIEIHTCSEVVKQEGYIGNFKLTILKKPPSDENELFNMDKVATGAITSNEYMDFIGFYHNSPPEAQKEFRIETGAIVIATGFHSYIPYQGEYGYREFPEVITLRELIRELAKNNETDEFFRINGRTIKNIAMIHCVGSRQVEGIHMPDQNGFINPNCSRTCCTGLLHSALEIINRHKGTTIFNIYRDIRTYGRLHEELYAEASAKGVRFVRFNVENQPVVKKNHEGYTLSVFAKDNLLQNEELEIPADLVVLATGMHPGEIEPLIDLLKIHCGADGFLLEVHPKLRPVEVFTAGIYLAGSCQAPMDVTEATAAASAAASKASILLSKGKVNLEPFVSKVDKDACARCLTCLRACPFDVPVMEDDGAYINPAACYGCGTCVSACPGGAISLAQYDNVEICSQVKGAIDPGITATNNEI
ncbi:MAG: CoB--CoM heterodisulfide reductase iron-sulfur subunit A family protein [Deltaproteobacteria bacterium]|nr:CoB--CoM heterodisulfide reductase iron-sulfur subunit A family protein [Deltaproteobacteria bacterium]